MTVLHPADVAILAAVSFVLMPPVPQAVPLVSVLTCMHHKEACSRSFPSHANIVHGS